VETPGVEIGEQPAFAVNVLNIFRRRFEGLVILSCARRNALAHEGGHVIDQALLILGKTKVQWRGL
jgi:hypothetical protein